MKIRLRGHAMNQRLLFLYTVFVLLAVTGLTFGGQPRSTGLILFGVACLLVCIYIAKVVAASTAVSTLTVRPRYAMPAPARSPEKAAAGAVARRREPWAGPNGSSA